MAVYKVPQDVEAEDKLIGPFSFRQFIYLIVAALAILAAWLLSRLFVGLAVIPLPIIVLFLALALPLRKDQPMETYLVAVVRFFLKPRTRMWEPDGAVGLVQITVPKTVEQRLTKDIAGDEAAQRLGYLAQVVDSRGWSTRGVSSANNMSAAMVDDVAAEAQTVEDVLDDDAQVSRSFDDMITRNNSSYRQTVAQQFQQAMQQPADQAASFGSLATTADDTYDTSAPTANLDYDPYPRSMHQRVIDPNGQQPEPPAEAPPSPASHGFTQHTAPVEEAYRPYRQEKPEPASTPAVSPDIMRLANNNDLSISAIAREAHRLEEKDDTEVVISLR